MKAKVGGETLARPADLSWPASAAIRLSQKTGVNRAHPSELNAVGIRTRVAITSYAVRSGLGGDTRSILPVTHGFR